MPACASYIRVEGFDFHFLKSHPPWQHSASHPPSPPASHWTLASRKATLHQYKNKPTISRVLIKTEHLATSSKHGVIQAKEQDPPSLPANPRMFASESSKHSYCLYNDFPPESGLTIGCPWRNNLILPADRTSTRVVRISPPQYHFSFFISVTEQQKLWSSDQHSGSGFTLHQILMPFFALCMNK